MTIPKAILCDFSFTLLLPLDASYEGSLNGLHARLIKENPSYDPWQHFRLNGELFPLFEQLRGKIPLYVWTSNYIQDYPPIRAKLDAVFDEVLSAALLSRAKDDPAAYSELAVRVGCTPHELLFIDDSERNVQAAMKAGLDTLRYGEDNVVDRLQRLIGALA